MTDAGSEGFSLVEMLVALAVFSLAAMALLNLSGESVRSAARVQERTLGGIVADNVAIAAVTGLGAPASEGVTTLAGREWAWTRLSSSTAVEGLERIDVRVRDQDGEVARRVLVRRVAQ